MDIIIRKVNDTYHMNCNGEKIALNGNAFDSVYEVIFTETPELIEKLITRNVVVGYENKNTGVSMSVERYDADCSELQAKGRYEDYEWRFDNLDAEFAYKKFLATWTPIKEEREVREKLGFVVYDITGNTDNPYIIPFRFLGKDPIKKDKVLYRYLPNVHKMKQEIAKKYDFVEVDDNTWNENTQGKKWSCPKHSLDILKFTKINGQYVHGHDSWRSSAIAQGTYDECLNAYNVDMTVIDGVFREALLRMKQTGGLLMCLMS